MRTDRSDQNIFRCGAALSQADAAMTKNPNTRLVNFAGDLDRATLMAATVTTMRRAMMKSLGGK
jgi:hypothetical protein